MRGKNKNVVDFISTREEWTARCSKYPANHVYVESENEFEGKIEMGEHLESLGWAVSITERLLCPICCLKENHSPESLVELLMTLFQSGTDDAMKVATILLRVK